MKDIQSKKGFTLLEVLFALAIFSIGLLAVNAMTTMVIKSNYMSKNFTTAVHLAQNKLDELKAGAYADVDAGTETNLNSQDISGAGIFAREVTLESCTPNCKAVTVKVSWADPEQREVVLKTIIAQ